MAGEGARGRPAVELERPVPGGGPCVAAAPSGVRRRQPAAPRRAGRPRPGDARGGAAGGRLLPLGLAGRPSPSWRWATRSSAARGRHRRGHEDDERGHQRLPRHGGRVRGRRTARPSSTSRRCCSSTVGPAASDTSEPARSEEADVQKVLVCNRGEIALRVIRTCRDMGIKTVQVYSKADATRGRASWPTRRSASAPAPAGRSYLHIPSIVHACLMTGADAVHPGYGFLSQDPYFAEICEDRASPSSARSPTVMEAMGDKSTARAADGATAGMPRARRRRSARSSLDEARGGGRAGRLPGHPEGLGGRRRARHAGGLRAAASSRGAAGSVKAAAQAVFKDNRVYLEKFIRAAAPRRDPGDGRPLRQRRLPGRARLLDPAPPAEADRGVALHLHRPPTCARRMGEAAVAGAKAIGYESAGTMEFLVDPDERLLLHGDEHPHPGRAPGDRGDDRARPHRDDDPGRRRRAAAASARKTSAAGARHRVPDQRRGPGRGLGRRRRRLTRFVPPRRRRRARGHPRLPRLRGAALLRLAAGQGDRAGRRPAPTRCAGWSGRSASSTAPG